MLQRCCQLLLALTLMSMTAHAQKVSYDWDKDIDFSPYRTYKWVEIESGKASLESTHKRIVRNVNVQLQAKRLHKTEDDDADLYVSYQVITDAKGSIASFNPDGQWHPGAAFSGDASNPPEGAKRKGALIIDVYDQKMKKLIWRGVVSGVFDSRQAVNYQIDKGLSKLFRYYPPPGHN